MNPYIQLLIGLVSLLALLLVAMFAMVFAPILLEVWKEKKRLWRMRK